MYVQLSPISRVELRLLHLNRFLLALQADLTFALVSPGLRPCVSQALSMTRRGYNEKHFFQNAWFITGVQEIPGTLADTTPNRESVGFLSFVGLIGSILSSSF